MWFRVCLAWLQLLKMTMKTTFGELQIYCINIVAKMFLRSKGCLEGLHVNVNSFL